MNSAAQRIANGNDIERETPVADPPPLPVQPPPAPMSLGRAAIYMTIDPGQPLAETLAPGLSMEVRIDKAAEPQVAK